MFGYLVTYKYVKTKLGEIMYFGTFYDYWGNIFDTVHFPPIVKQFPFVGRGIYKLYGKVVNDFDYYSLEITKMEKMQQE